MQSPRTEGNAPRAVRGRAFRCQLKQAVPLPSTLIDAVGSAAVASAVLSSGTSRRAYMHLSGGDDQRAPFAAAPHGSARGLAWPALRGDALHVCRTLDGHA